MQILSTDLKFHIVEKFGHNYILVQGRDRYAKATGVPEANFLETNCALCGILKQGKTLQQFILKYYQTHNVTIVQNEKATLK